jgi:hypothetical protein
MKKKMQKVSIFLCWLLVLCLFSIQFPTSLAFETKQPIDYNWLWEVSDLDDFTDPSIPFDRYSYHTLVKAQVVGDHLFVARGTDIPCEFLWIDVPSGDIQYAGQFLSKWNQQLPFVYHHSSIILTFKDSIEEIELKTKRLQQFHSIPISSSTQFCIGATDHSILLEEPSISIQKITKSTQTLEWEYLFPDSIKQYKVVGCTEKYLALIENLMDQWHIRFLSMDSGEVVFQSSLPQDTLRISSQLQPSSKPTENTPLFLSILTQDGFGTAYTFLIPPNQVEEVPFLQATKTIPSPLWEESQLITYRPSVNEEIEGLGWKVFWEETSPVVCSSISSPKQGSTLRIQCLDESYQPRWQKDYTSTEHNTDILQDAYLHDEMVTFQYPLQKPSNSILCQAFWLDIENGNKVEEIYHKLDIMKESPEKGIILFPNILIATDFPDSMYMDSIFGWYFYYYNFARENLGTVHYSPMQSTTLAENSYRRNPDDWKLERYPSFVYQHEIRYFVSHYNEELKETIHSCARFDMIQKKNLPPIEFPQFYGFDIDKMILHDQYLVTAVDKPYDTPLLICYDLEKGRIAWEEYYNIIGMFETSFLARHRSQKGTTFSAIKGESGEEMWSFTFPSQDTYFCGIDDNGQAYIKRNSILSVLDMKSGALNDEILLTFSDPINTYIHGNYILFQTYSSTFSCLHIPTKEILWTKDLGDYAQCLLEEKKKYEWTLPSLKGVFVSESHLLSFNQEGFHLIDMMSGTPLWLYPTPLYQIVDLYFVQADSFIALAKDSTDNAFMMQFSLAPGKPLEINLYDISKQHVGWEIIDPAIAYQNNYFVVKNNYKDVFIMELEKASVPQTKNQLLKVEPRCTNYLYYKNNLIFQACVGTDNSDYYLLAYNMTTGILHKIQKGFHENVHIEWDLLYFELDGLYYCCSFQDFKPSVCSDFHPYHLAGYKENLGSYSRFHGYNPLSPGWDVLDAYYIQQVLHGHFTQSSETELLFLTGDGNHSKIGMMAEGKGLDAPVVAGSLDFKSMPNAPYLPFRQSLLQDVNGDGLEELVVLYFSLENKEAYIALWMYSEKQDDFISMPLFHDTAIQKPELLAIDGAIYFQYESLLEKEKPLQQTCQFFYEPDTENAYSLQSIEKHVPTQMYMENRGSEVNSFQFLENLTVNDSLTYQETTCKQFPGVQLFPPHFQTDFNQITEEESQYIHKRNAALKSFLELLDTGVDPFEGTMCTIWQGNQKPYQRPFQLKQLRDEEENKKDYEILCYIDSLFPIQAEGKDYIVVRASSKYYYTHIFLFNPLFECVDSYTYYRPSKGGISSDAMVSLQNPSRFWIQSDTNTGVDRLLFGNISNDQLQIKNQFGKFYLYEKQLFHGEKVVFIEKWDTICNIDAKGTNCMMQGYHFLDVWSGHQSDQLLLKEMKQQLPLLYSTLLYYQSFYAKPTLIHEYGGKRIQLTDGREKPLYLSDACYVTQYFEFVFYCYDKYYK